MSRIVRLKYTGSAPGANTDTHTLFSTTGLPGGVFQATGMHSFRFGIKNSQAGTVKGYKSSDRGTTWHQVYELACAASTSTTENTDVVSVEGYQDFKFDWTNGGAAQATWSVDMNMSVVP